MMSELEQRHKMQAEKERRELERRAEELEQRERQLLEWERQERMQENGAGGRRGSRTHSRDYNSADHDPHNYWHEGEKDSMDYEAYRYDRETRPTKGEGQTYIPKATSRTTRKSHSARPIPNQVSVSNGSNPPGQARRPRRSSALNVSVRPAENVKMLKRALTEGKQNINSQEEIRAVSATIPTRAMRKRRSRHDTCIDGSDSDLEAALEADLSNLNRRLIHNIKSLEQNNYKLDSIDSVRVEEQAQPHPPRPRRQRSGNRVTSGRQGSHARGPSRSRSNRHTQEPEAEEANAQLYQNERWQEQEYYRGHEYRHSPSRSPHTRSRRRSSVNSIGSVGSFGDGPSWEVGNSFHPNIARSDPQDLQYRQKDVMRLVVVSE